MASGQEARIFVLCGERSGDSHAAMMVAELLKLRPVRVFAAGGPKLREAGAELLWETVDWGAIGIPDALRRAPKLMRAAREIVRWILRERPELVVLVDFGAFNVPVGRAVKRLRRQQRILYYFPPASWDRRRRRWGRLLRACDFIATPFPWNAASLAAQGASVRWVGHPAADRIKPPEDKAEAKRRVGVSPEAVVVGVLPGSRRTERLLVGGAVLRACEVLKYAAGRVEFLWSRVEGLEAVDEALGIGRWRAWARPVGDVAAVLAASDVALCCMGTVTLEAALAEVPHVAVYRGTPAMKLQWHLLQRRRVPVRYAALPNIALQEAVVPELLGDAAEPEAIARACREVLERRDEVVEKLRRVREVVGGEGAARRAAEAVVDALEGRFRPHRLWVE